MRVKHVEPWQVYRTLSFIHHCLDCAHTHTDTLVAVLTTVCTQLSARTHAAPPLQGAHIYFCGLKGMMPGIQDMLKAVAASKNIEYEKWVESLKHKNQWHVEVY